MKKIKLLAGLSSLGILSGSIATIVSGCTWHFVGYDSKLIIDVDGGAESITITTDEQTVPVSIFYEGGEVGLTIASMTVESSDPGIFTVELEGDPQGSDTANVKITGVKSGKANLIVVVTDSEGHTNRKVIEITIDKEGVDASLSNVKWSLNGEEAKAKSLETFRRYYMFSYDLMYNGQAISPDEVEWFEVDEDNTDAELKAMGYDLPELGIKTIGIDPIATGTFNLGIKVKLTSGVEFNVTTTVDVTVQGIAKINFPEVDFYTEDEYIGWFPWPQVFSNIAGAFGVMTTDEGGPVTEPKSIELACSLPEGLEITDPVYKFYSVNEGTGEETETTHITCKKNDSGKWLFTFEPDEFESINNGGEMVRITVAEESRSSVVVAEQFLGLFAFSEFVTWHNAYEVQNCTALQHKDLITYTVPSSGTEDEKCAIFEVRPYSKIEILPGKELEWTAYLSMEVGDEWIMTEDINVSANYDPDKNGPAATGTLTVTISSSHKKLTDADNAWLYLVCKNNATYYVIPFITQLIVQDE